MKKLLFVLGLGTCSSLFGQGAVVDRGDRLCDLPPSITGLGTTVPMEWQRVTTKPREVIIICHGDVPEGFEPDERIDVRGFFCNDLQGNTTTDTTAKITPSGKALMKCHFHHND